MKAVRYMCPSYQQIKRFLYSFLLLAKLSRYTVKVYLIASYNKLCLVKNKLVSDYKNIFEFVNVYFLTTFLTS